MLGRKARGTSIQLEVSGLSLTAMDNLCVIKISKEQDGHSVSLASLLAISHQRKGEVSLVCWEELNICVVLDFYVGIN